MLVLVERALDRLLISRDRAIQAGRPHYAGPVGRQVPGGSGAAPALILALPPPPHPDSSCPRNQATATRATKLELDRDYDAAFTAYITAAHTYLFLVRHTVDPDSKTKFRAVSAKLVERAERIKRARNNDIKPVQRNPLSLGAHPLSPLSSLSSAS